MNGVISIDGRDNLMPDNSGNFDSSDDIFTNDERTVGGNLVKSIDGIDNDCNDIAYRDN
jgi:hypothetical protein